MDVFGEAIEYERKFEKFIRSVPSTLQKPETNVSSEQGAGISGNEHRRSNDPSCQRVGCSCSLLHDQHRQSSDGDFSRSTGEMAVSTFKPVGEVDIDFSGQEGNSDSNKCGMEIRVPENHKDLVRSVSNRRQGYQKTNNSDTTGNRFSELSYIPLEDEWEIGKDTSALLGVRELRRNDHMVPSSITETRAANRNLCNNDIYTKSDTALRELRNEREPQHTLDLPSLLKLLNDEYPYRNETNKNILTDREIRLFAKLYGITNFDLMFVTYDAYFVWLEDPNGVYFWSRIDGSMIRGGSDLKEALTNYLFHDENLYFVDEYTFKLVPINTYDEEDEEDEEAEEWENSPEKYFAKIDVTEILQMHG